MNQLIPQLQQFQIPNVNRFLYSIEMLTGQFTNKRRLVVG